MKKLPTLSRTLAEKVSFTISLAILSFIIALIIYTWITGSNEPAILNVQVDGEIYQQQQQEFYVPFSVTNLGGKTAQSVEVIGELTLSDHNTQRGVQQINYLSQGEKQSGVFVFTHNPQQGKLEIRVASFKKLP